MRGKISIKSVKEFINSIEVIEKESEKAEED